MQFRSAHYLHILVPCPLGWGSASKDTVGIAWLAKESGLFPVFEAEHGELVSSSKIRRQVPVEDYLRPQARYAHLFGEHLPVTDVPAAMRADGFDAVLLAVGRTSPSGPTYPPATAPASWMPLRC